MSFKKRRHAFRQAPPGASGGGHPANRKALQLCAQVTRTLQSVLVGECNDDILRDLMIESVVPAPGSNRLIVSVYPLTLAGEVSAAEILTRLEQAQGLLRSEVAADIHRRKTPELIFRLARAV